MVLRACFDTQEHVLHSKLEILGRVSHGLVHAQRVALQKKTSLGAHTKNERRFERRAVHVGVESSGRVVDKQRSRVHAQRSSRSVLAHSNALLELRQQRQQQALVRDELARRIVPRG